MQNRQNRLSVRYTTASAKQLHDLHGKFDSIRNQMTDAIKELEAALKGRIDTEGLRAAFGACKTPEEVSGFAGSQGWSNANDYSPELVERAKRVGCTRNGILEPHKVAWVSIAWLLAYSEL